MRILGKQKLPSSMHTPPAFANGHVLELQAELSGEHTSASLDTSQYSHVHVMDDEP